ncbi:MAG: hypothetical protein WCL37_07835, partial [Chrysiogenales bacterium]
MKKLFVWLAVVFIIVQFAACVHTNTTVLNAANIREPIDPVDVIIYTTASRVPGDYEEIALLNSKADSASSNEAQMFKSMRKKAAKLGANAIILDAVSEPTVGAKIAAAILFGTGAERKGKALAVYVIPGSKKTRHQSIQLDPEDYIDKYVRIKAQNYPFQGGDFTDVVIRGVVFDYQNKTITLLVLNSNIPEALTKNQIKKLKLGPRDSIEIIKAGLDEATKESVAEKKKEW